MLVQPIPITVQNGAKENELVLLEFQGEFEHTELEAPLKYENRNQSNLINGLDLGQLVERAAGNYELTVGNHLLKGKSAFAS